MKKTILYAMLGLLVIGCTESQTDADAVDPIQPSNPNTAIPTSGIYKSSDTEAIKYLKVVNYARGIARTCGEEGDFEIANPVRFNLDLYLAALEHSQDMAQNNIFSHQGSGNASDITGSNLGKKSTFVERIEANGYVDYSTIGENILVGEERIEEVVDGWIDSPGHCANLMNPDFEEMGLAQYEGSSRLFWTQVFGTR